MDLNMLEEEELMMLETIENDLKFGGSLHWVRGEG